MTPVRVSMQLGDMNEISRMFAACQRHWREFRIERVDGMVRATGDGRLLAEGDDDPDMTLAVQSACLIHCYANLGGKGGAKPAIVDHTGRRLR